MTGARAARQQASQDAALFAARVLLAALFFAGFAQKLADPAPAAGLLRGLGLPGALVWPAAAFNLAAGLALLAGAAVRPVALALAVYCAVTSVFHLVPDDPWQMSIFVKNWAIAGGCLALSVAGAGRWVLPGLRRGRGPLGSRERSREGDGT